MFWYVLFYKNLIVLHHVDNNFLFYFEICIKFTLSAIILAYKKIFFERCPRFDNWSYLFLGRWVQKWYQICSITLGFWDVGYPNFHPFLIFSWQKVKQSSLFDSRKNVCLKNKLNNNFKYRLDVKDLLKASLHWKIMSLSKVSFQEVLHR